MERELGDERMITLLIENVEKDTDREDYLQDPEMWGDRLPQPYRMIDRILNELLDKVWAKIEHGETLRKTQKTKVTHPSVTSGNVVCGDMLASSCGGVCEGREVTFVAGEKSLHAIKSNMEVTAKYDFQQQINGLSVEPASEIVDIVFAQLETEIRVLGYLHNNFIEVTELPHQSKDKILKMSLASSCSHVAVAYVSQPLSGEKGQPQSGDKEKGIPGGTKLAIFSLPVNSWMADFPTTFDETSQVSMTSLGKEVTFSKPSLLYTISPPHPLCPATATPYSVFQNVSEQAGNAVPSGDLHSLTKLYFDHRERVFATKRRDFLSPDASHQQQVALQTTPPPTCHFLCYRLYHKLSYACEVAVWWEDSTILTIYPLEELSTGKGSSTVPPTRNFPQASPILCSCVSQDSTMLALGLKRGVVVLWDMKMDLFFQAVQCVQLPNMISALQFFKCPSVHGLMLGIGTSKGKVLILDATVGTRTHALSLNSKVQQQQHQAYSDLFISSGFSISSKVVSFKLNPDLPSLLTAVHENGTFVLWAPTEQTPVCKLCLDTSLSPLSPALCTFSNTGQQFLTAGADKESDSCSMVNFELSGIPTLSKYWGPQCLRTTSAERDQCSRAKMILLDAPEAHLKDYVKQRLTEMDENLVKWQENWKELPNRLTRTAM